MTDPHRTYEFRCPVYGFISLNDWEREIISQPAFQRLRRIRQLAWTDYVYPGAMHTRFEHSLGVMHMATLLYEGIVERSRGLLESELGYTEEGLKRTRSLVRVAALLHDVGHSPFSHAGEGLFPRGEGDPPKQFKHEDYSAEIVRRCFADVIEEHPINKANYGFSAEDVASLLEGSAKAKTHLFWKVLITGQMDADRMDYLLRDSLHAGVDYGRYDWRRIVNTIVATPGPEEGSAPCIGITEGGWHAAEGLILARYFMFTQVYFHKTRVAFDHHLQHALKELLPGGQFPGPKGKELDEYLHWDDWRILGMLADGKGGEHGHRLAERKHFREVYHTPETPTANDLETLKHCRTELGKLLAAEESSAKSWYKVDESNILVLNERSGRVFPLSNYSSFVAKIEAIRQVLLYVRPEDAKEARRRIQGVRGDLR